MTWNTYCGLEFVTPVWFSYTAGLKSMTERKLLTLENSLPSSIYFLSNIYLRFPLTTVRMGKIKRISVHITGKDAGRGEPSFTIGGIAICCSYSGNCCR